MTVSNAGVSSTSSYGFDESEQVVKTATLIWDTNALTWIKSTGGGGAASSVSVTNFPATQAVSGTFWQATQPVSIASMPSTPVTGTFFQATQPVSIASMPSTPVTGTFWQATQPVSGTFFQATQPVSLASMPITPVTGSVAITSTVQATNDMQENNGILQQILLELRINNALLCQLNGPLQDDPDVLRDDLATLN